MIRMERWSAPRRSLAISAIGSVPSALIERSNRQATFLAQISAALTSTRNFEETLKTIASLAVPHIADWCGVDVVREDGRIARLAIAHIDPAKIALAERLRERYESSDSPNSPPFVIRTGTPAADSCISDDMIVAGGKGRRGVHQECPCAWPRLVSLCADDGARSHVRRADARHRRVRSALCRR